MPRNGGISHIRAGLGVRKPATEAGFRPTVSEDDILVSRFLERTARPAARHPANDDPARQADEISRAWVESFGAAPLGSKVEGVRRCFEGKALVRMRATVAHDSYERLVEVTCAPGEHKAHAVRSGLYKLTDVIENAHHLGIDTERLADAAQRDPGIAEFCRFYNSPWWRSKARCTGR
jgi:hypothetical protein